MLTPRSNNGSLGEKGKWAGETNGKIMTDWAGRFFFVTWARRETAENGERGASRWGQYGGKKFGN